MLCAWIKLLMMLFGRACKHMTNVTTACFLIQEKVAMQERTDKHNVVCLLWAIVTDARACFSTPHNVVGTPPVSHPDWLIGGMRGGTLPTTLTWHPVAISVQKQPRGQ